jgi:hypothetical protein
LSSKAPSKHSDWSNFLLNEDTLDYSDRELSNIHCIGPNSIAPTTMFFKLSRNPAICLMFPDASEELLQVLHHPTVIGSSWQQKEKNSSPYLALQQNLWQYRLFPSPSNRFRQNST